MFLVILLYALFASVFTIAKTGLEYTQPFFLVASRMMFAGLLLVAYQYWYKGERFILSKKACWRIFCLAFFNIYLTNAFEFWGLKYLTSFKTCFIYSLSPFVSVLFSYFLFTESLNWRKWMGLLVGFAGFIPILMAQSASEEQTGELFFFSWAELAVMCAAVSSVYGWIVLKQLVNEEKYTPLMANGLSMLVGGGFALVHSLCIETWDPVPVTSFWPYFECTVLLIITSNMICYNLYGHLLQRFSATFMSFAGFTTPLFTALFGWFFLGEVVTMPFYVSFAIVFMGLLMYYQEELKQIYATRKAAYQI